MTCSGVPRIGQPIGCSGKSRGIEEIENEIVGRVLDRADLLQDDLFLALQLVLVEDALGQDIGENVDREPGVAGQHMRVIGGLLDARRGIEVAAGAFDLLGNVARRAPPRALEGHMFEKMREAALARALMPRTRRHPDAKRDGFEMRHPVGDDAQAGRERGDLDAHEAALFFARAP